MKKNQKLIVDGKEYDTSHDVDLRYTQITSLPEGLSVGGHLYLRDTQITSLPEGLSVGGVILSPCL